MTNKRQPVHRGPKTSPFRPYALCLLLITLAGTSGLAAAQNNYDLGVLDPGEIMLNLDASEQTEVEQDTLHASLYFAARGRDRVALQNEVNRKMADALELLADGEVEYTTQQYHVYQVQVDRPARGDIDNRVWRAELVEVTFNASNNFFARNMTTMAMSGEAAMDMARPVAEPGMTTVMLSVSACASLTP